MTVKEFFIHKKRAPVMYAIILPLCSLILMMIDYSINGTVNLTNPLATLNLYLLGYIPLIFSAIISGLCSRHLSSVFLKVNTDNVTIRNAFDLLGNMDQVVFRSIFVFAGALIIQAIFYLDIINIKDITNYETALFYFLTQVMIILIMVSVISVFTRFSDNFEFGFARICFRFYLSKETILMEKTEFLVKGINAYNQFLANSSSIEIKDKDSLLSKIISKTPEIRMQEIEKLEKSFDNGGLGPLEQIQTIDPITKPENFVKAKQRFSKLKTMLPIIGSVVSAVIIGSVLLLN